jgi:hypothetical protein
MQYRRLVSKIDGKGLKKKIRLMSRLKNIASLIYRKFCTMGIQ